MKVPHDPGAPVPFKALARLGCAAVRQTGSDIGPACDGELRHAITIPNHLPFRVGTLADIHADVGRHHEMSYEHRLARSFDD